jgi:transcriptional regulator with XRE-family HTH domain
MDARKKTAERIKAARSMAGFSERKAFCLKFDLPLATLEAWERGKNPLTLKGAKRIVEALKSVDIYCSEKWLMEGKGFSPRTLDEVSLELDLAAPNTLTSIEENLKIAKEISTFKTLNEGAIVTIVSDSGLSPFFEEGDYVGGVRYMGASIDKGLGKRCIVELKGGAMIVRLLIKGANGTYSLERTNKALKILPGAEENIAILSATPIIWHRSFL